MFLKNPLLHIVAGLVAALTWSMQAAALPVLIETPSPFENFTPKPDNFGSYGVLAKVTVGGGDVDIAKIGVHGRVINDLTMKWLVFEDRANGSSPVLQTSALSFNQTNDFQWYDSPEFSPFTLLANQTYWIGSAISGPEGAFLHSYNSPGTEVIANGLVLPAGVNANVATGYAAPTLNTGTGNVQVSLRLYGPAAVPEPATLALLSLGIAGFGYQRRRRLNARS